MKYRNPNTGELKDIYVKASDTLPIGTIVDYEGDTVPDGYEKATSEILWQNSNPNTSFASQDITLSSSDYDELIWIFDTYVGSGLNITCNSLKGFGVRATASNSSGSSTLVRSINRSSDTTFTVGDGYNSNAVDNNSMIPRCVIAKKYGIRKKEQSIGVLGKVLNSNSTSEENTYSCDYINKSTGFIGWTNPNPTSEFSAQTITLSTSDFDEYEIEYLVVIGATSTKSTGRISKNNTAYLDYIGGSGTLKGFYRMVMAINNNYINFNDTIYSNDGSTANVRCIPQRVILYKNL